MKFGLSASLVKKSLASHSWLGLLVGFPMYLVCLSGTLAVFYLELERWEQPLADEMESVAPALVDKAYNAALARQTEETHHIFIGLPREALPRVTVSSDHGGWQVDADGSLGDPVRHDWTHLLLHLHLYLHLPESFGMLIVSALGALLCGLIISGFLAHPGLFKDAFRLRLKGGRQLEQTDIHNRLSVWGAPFHLMIAITGAYFGLVGPMALIFASADFDGDTDAVVAAVFGEEPALSQPLQPAAVGTALAAMPSIAPEATPFFITVEDVGTPEQFIVVSGAQEGRLIWSEQYHFDAAGTYLGKAGYSDGEAGRQAIFSVYRIHFGQFGGFPMKLLFVVFGLALTVVSVTGINIWLAKRPYRDFLNPLWTGLVWGTPVALALTAFTQIVLDIPSTALLWVALVAAVVWTQWLNDDRRARCMLQLVCAGMLVALLIGYAIKFGGEAFLSAAAIGVNGGIAFTALILIGMAARGRKARATASVSSRSRPV